MFVLKTEKPEKPDAVDLVSEKLKSLIRKQLENSDYTSKYQGKCKVITLQCSHCGVDSAAMVLSETSVSHAAFVCMECRAHTSHPDDHFCGGCILEGLGCSYKGYWMCEKMRNV